MRASIIRTCTTSIVALLEGSTIGISLDKENGLEIIAVDYDVSCRELMESVLMKRVHPSQIPKIAWGKQRDVWI